MAALCAALEELASTSSTSLSSAELTEFVLAGERARAQLDAVLLGALEDFDARGLAIAAGARSSGTWLRDTARVDTATAKKRIGLGRALVEFAATGAALAAGRISTAQARAIVEILARLKRKHGLGECAEAEKRLLGNAAQMEPDRLRKVGKHLEYVLDPDGAAPREDEARKQRTFALHDLGNGTHRPVGIVDDLLAAKIKAALDPLAAPRPGVDGVRDERSHGRRYADALEELLDRYLAHGQAPKTRGEAPHLIITAGLDTLLGLPGAPAAATTTGQTVSAELLRKLACDANITRVLTGPDSMPLDVGRKHRTASWAQWAALLIRDKGCTGPGCDTPAGWCQIHHLTPWANGGNTDLADLTLVCSHCHDLTHHEGWNVQLGRAGRVEWIPPPHVDPSRRPRVNSYHHNPTLFDPP